MKEKLSLSGAVFNVFNYAILIAFTIICVFPLYFILINTLSTNDLAVKNQILFWPIGLHFENYIRVFQLRGLWDAAKISLSRTVLGTFLTVTVSSFLGYAFSRPEYWKKTIWYRFVVVTMYFNAGMIPFFLTVKLVGLYDNFFVYILPAMVAPFFVILTKTFIEQIPASLEESAQLDGAGYLVRYSRIVLPLSVPILATIAVFASVGQWNAFFDTVYLTRGRSLNTLQLLLLQYLNEADAVARAIMNSTSPEEVANMLNHQTPTSVRMTVTLITTFPILCVYPFMQRFFIKGIMVGAIKG